MEDLTGKQFGRWMVISYSGKDKHGCALWNCKCECGTERPVSGYNLKSGDSKSCGCLARNKTIERETIHGQSKTRLFKIWKGMRKRCNNPNDRVYKFYGGRGIKVCKEWDDFMAFHDWAYQNGYDDTATGHACTIDRIDSNGDYCPENCRWADVEMQHSNTRRNHYITIDGETKMMRDWSRTSGVSMSTIIRRLESGWSEKDAVFISPHSGNRYNKILKDRKTEVM